MRNSWPLIQSFRSIAPRGVQDSLVCNGFASLTLSLQKIDIRKGDAVLHKRFRLRLFLVIVRIFMSDDIKTHIMALYCEVLFSRSVF